MTPEERIDAALDSVLIFTGMTLFDYESHPAQLKGMREAMRKIMSDSYIQGSHDARDAIIVNDKK